MNLAQRDKMFIELKSQIECKQRAMLERFDALRSAANENKLLDRVLADYVAYYKEALASKKREEEALIVLRDYLESMSDAIQVSDVQMDYLKAERDQTIARLQSVRRDMQDLLNRTREGALAE